MSFSASVEKLVADSKDLLVAKAPEWDRIPLASVAHILNGFPLKSELFTERGGTPVIRIRDVTAGQAGTFYRGPIPEGYWVEPGDIVIGMDGDFNSRIWEDQRALLNQRVCKLEPDETKIDKLFLAYVLPGYLRLINEATHSITVKHLSSKTIGQIPLPYPPLDEQRRIVAKLDALFAHTQRARAELARVPRLIERARQAVTSMAIKGELTNEWRNSHKNEWRDVFFEELLAKEKGAIRRGPFGSSIKKSFFVPQGYKVYEQKNAIQDDPTLGNYYINEEKFQELNGFSVFGGDFIVSCAGTIGRISQLPPDAQPGIINQALMRLRLDNTAIIPEYFLALFRSQDLQTQILENAQGSAMQNLAEVKVIRRLPVKLPSLSEQTEIVRRIEAAFARIERMAAEAHRAAALLDRLEQAALAKAFRGELVDAEPAAIDTALAGVRNGDAATEGAPAQLGMDLT